MKTSVVVFVVEDRSSIRDLLKEALTEGGFDVTLASSGEEAVAILDREGADFQALVTDIDLGGARTGWDVARHAREIKVTMPVIYITGASAHEWGSKGVPHSQLMPKPFMMAMVVTEIARLIDADVASAASTLAPLDPVAEVTSRLHVEP